MSSTSEPSVVLGIDPGSRHTGFAVIRTHSGGLDLLACGAISPQTKLPLAARLDRIFAGLEELITAHRPGEMAVEGVFTHKNARSALALGQARGVALLAGARHGLEVFEYQPTVVKQSLVGTGRASKEQVRAMVLNTLGRKLKLSLDASDAAAIALTHLQTRRMLGLMAKIK